MTHGQSDKTGNHHYQNHGKKGAYTIERIKPIGDVSPQHDQFTVCDVQEPHGPVNEIETHGDKGINAPDDQSSGDNLQNLG